MQVKIRKHLSLEDEHTIVGLQRWCFSLKNHHFSLSGQKWSAIALWAVHSNNLDSASQNLCPPWALPGWSGEGKLQAQVPVLRSIYCWTGTALRAWWKVPLKRSWRSSEFAIAGCWFVSGRLVWMWLSETLSPEVTGFILLPLAASPRGSPDHP